MLSLMQHGTTAKGMVCIAIARGVKRWSLRDLWPARLEGRRFLARGLNMGQIVPWTKPASLDRDEEVPGKICPSPRVDCSSLRSSLDEDSYHSHSCSGQIQKAQGICMSHKLPVLGLLTSHTSEIIS